MEPTNDQWDLLLAQDRQLLKDMWKYAPQIRFMVAKGAFDVRNGEVQIYINKAGDFKSVKRTFNN